MDGCLVSFFPSPSLLSLPPRSLPILMYVPLINPPDSLGEGGGGPAEWRGEEGGGKSAASCHLHSSPAGQNHESVFPNCSGNESGRHGAEHKTKPGVENNWGEVAAGAPTLSCFSSDLPRFLTSLLCLLSPSLLSTSLFPPSA